MKVKLTFTGAELAVLYEAYGVSLKACFYRDPEAISHFRSDGEGGKALNFASLLFSYDGNPEVECLSEKLSQIAHWAVGSFRTSTTTLVGEFLSHRKDVPQHENKSGAYSDGTGQFDLIFEVAFEYEGLFDRDYDGHAFLRLAILEDALRTIIRGVQTSGSWPLGDRLVRPSHFGTLPSESKSRGSWLDEPLPDSKWSGIATVSAHASWHGADTSNDEWALILWQLSFRWFWMLANQMYLDIERNFGLRFTSAMLDSVDQKVDWKNTVFWKNPAVLFRDSRITSFVFAMDGEANASRRIDRRSPVTLWSFAKEVTELSSICAESIEEEIRDCCVFCFSPSNRFDHRPEWNQILCDECREAYDALVPAEDSR